jgi:putative transposase
MTNPATALHHYAGLNSVAMVLSAGQAGDNPMLWPLLDLLADTDINTFRLLADKAYSHDSTRARLRQLKIAHTIPERSDQIERRKAKGSKGGRPPAFVVCHELGTSVT